MSNLFTDAGVIAGASCFSGSLTIPGVSGAPDPAPPSAFTGQGGAAYGENGENGGYVGRGGLGSVVWLAPLPESRRVLLIYRRTGAGMRRGGAC